MAGSKNYCATLKRQSSVKYLLNILYDVVYIRTIPHLLCVRPYTPLAHGQFARPRSNQAKNAYTNFETLLPRTVEKHTTPACCSLNHAVQWTQTSKSSNVCLKIADLLAHRFLFQRVNSYGRHGVRLQRNQETNSKVSRWMKLVCDWDT